MFGTRATPATLTFVEIGEIEPENVRTYGVFVDYVVEGGKL